MVYMIHKYTIYNRKHLEKFEKWFSVSLKQQKAKSYQMEQRKGSAGGNIHQLWLVRLFSLILYTHLSFINRI